MFSSIDTLFKAMTIMIGSGIGLAHVSDSLDEHGMKLLSKITGNISLFSIIAGVGISVDVFTKMPLIRL